MAEAHVRKQLTRSQLAQLILSQEGRCAACKCKLDFTQKGQVIDEHIVPIFSTPEGADPNRTENRELRCKPCATKKTSSEAPMRAKVRRIEGENTQADKRERAKEEGRYRPIQGKTLVGGGFAGSRRFNGEINWKTPTPTPRWTTEE